jgi:hypothetical protein
MRNKKGQFIKGTRNNIATEFKKGQHWRPHQSFREYQWLFEQYKDKKRSAQEIANDFNITEAAIYFWLRKHKIPARKMTEIRAQKYWGLKGEKNGMYGRRGAENPHYKNGCTPEKQLFYETQEWKDACSFVWKRDKAKCIRCSKSSKESKLHVHHIISFSIKELRSNTNNLVLLCSKCHRFIHSKRNINKEFIKEVI